PPPPPRTGLFRHWSSNRTLDAAISPTVGRRSGGDAMRATAAGLATPPPIGEHLPALFQEDEFAQRFVGALDEVLAPVFAVLDCLDAYLDPWLAPPDFVDWLADWVALT